VGTARTALFNWLFARHHGGKFILRIEDTDVTRSTQESVEAILESMEWLGLDWDEGPVYQSQRLDIYRRHVQRLLDEGKAYRCYCRPEDLETKRKQAIEQKRKPKYDGTCRALAPPFPDGPYAVRFRSPQEGETAFRDLIKGDIVFDNSELDDLIILRSDRMPTYNFAVVVDDVTMGITHVIRRDDHVNNTPRQILLFQAFSYPLPLFAHVPMILGSDKTRLSKRHGAESVLAYREMGYLPQGLMNYLVRLGWAHGDEEFFTVDEMVRKFTLENVGTSAGMFDPEKLRSINGDHLKASSARSIATLLIPFLEAIGHRPEEGEKLLRIVEALKERAKTLTEMADQAEFCFQETIEYEEKAARKFLGMETLPVFKTLIGRLEGMERFTEGELEVMFRGVADEMEIKLGRVAQPVRVALTGKTASPGLFEVMEILGKEEVLKRLERVVEFIQKER
jgi:glutamyl-tRNA synthetase